MAIAGPELLRILLRLLRAACIWALAASVTTAFVSDLARTLCLPPYWPQGPVLGCRPEMARALLRVPVDVVITVLLMVVPALGIGLVVQLLVLALRGFPPSVARGVAAIIGGVLWFIVVARLEPSPLDFIISGYATAAGALAGALITMRARHP